MSLSSHKTLNITFAIFSSHHRQDGKRKRNRAREWRIRGPLICNPLLWFHLISSRISFKLPIATRWLRSGPALISNDFTLLFPIDSKTIDLRQHIGRTRIGRYTSAPSWGIITYSLHGAESFLSS